MKIICSKCHTPIKSEFDEMCHKCGHVFRNIKRHIVTKPHHYHIVRDALFLIILIIAVYYVFNVYKAPKGDVTVNVPEIETPKVEINQSSQQIIINVTNEQNKEYSKSRQAEMIGEYNRQKRVLRNRTTVID